MKRDSKLYTQILVTLLFDQRNHFFFSFIQSTDQHVDIYEKGINEQARSITKQTRFRSYIHVRACLRLSTTTIDLLFSFEAKVNERKKEIAFGYIHMSNGQPMYACVRSFVGIYKLF